MPEDDVLQSFMDEGLITEAVQQLKSGKEAIVWLVRKEERHFAAKIYRQRATRAFHNDVTYRAGRAILEDRVARAVARKTGFGREAGQALWLDHEYRMLRDLARTGADVPGVAGRVDGGILLSLVTLDGEPAPQLREAVVRREDAAGITDRLLWNIEVMLAENVIHADLSPFNVLLGDGGPVVIDFPQAVDARSNPNARELLFRDVESVCRWGSRYGVEVDGFSVSLDLWSRWERAML